jgi:hypothetical protein
MQRVLKSFPGDELYPNFPVPVHGIIVRHKGGGLFFLNKIALEREGVHGELGNRIVISHN